VVLTIDAELQRITEAALKGGVEKVQAQSGVAVVMSPGTGEVLAMACYPAFDPASAEEAPAKLRRNRAVTDPTEPGSTFKPFIASGALEGSYVSLTEQIDCHMGSKFFGSREIRDVKKCGMLDLRGILTYSSNIGMVTIAERMGNPALHHTIRRFGFGAPTGIEYPGESEGLVRPLKKWGRLSTQSVAMGYEISTTPLQLAAAFSAIVNDGVLLRPRLVHQTLNAEGEVVRDSSQPVVVNRVIASKTAQLLTQDLLASVVEEGSGRHAKLDHYKVSGKSGTAKLPFEHHKGYEPGAYMGAFLGASSIRSGTPPELAVVVMIRRPDATLGYYGGATAAPVVGEILRFSLAYLQVPPDETMLATADRN
jgi:cell division protein FtsI (penicillin-binding protein 3)